MFASGATAGAQGTFQWIGGNGLNWNTPQNWSPAQVPGIQVRGADAVVESAAGVVTASTGGPITLNTLQTSTAVKFSGIGLTLAGGDTTDLQFLAGSIMTLDGALLLRGSTQLGAAVIQGPPVGEVENLGVCTLVAGGSLSLKKPFRNSGLLSLGSSISLQSGAILTNDAVMEALAPGSFTISGSSPAAFVNGGTFTRDGTGSLSVQSPFTNGPRATAQVSAGELRLQGPSSLEGAFVLANDATIRIQPPSGGSADVPGDLSLEGRGDVVVTGSLDVHAGATLTASLHADSPHGLLLQSALPVNVDGTVQNLGPMTWDYLVLQGSGQLLNGGALELTASSRTLLLDLKNQQGGTVSQAGPLTVGNAVVTNEAGALWTLAAGNITALPGSQPVFVNAGTLARTGSTAGQYSFVSVPTVCVDAIVSVAGPGFLAFTADSSFDGPGNVLYTEAECRFGFNAGTATVAGTLKFTGQGRCTVESGAVLACAGGVVENHILPLAPGAMLSINGGTVTRQGEGALVNFHTMELVGAKLGTEDNPAAMVVNKGNASTTGFTSVGGTLVNEAGHLFSQTGQVQLYGGTITNRGTYMLLTTGGIFVGRGGGAFNNEAGGTLISQLPDGTGPVMAATLDNQGTVRVESGVLSLPHVAQVQGSTLAGGRWELGPNALLRFTGALVSTVGSGTVLVLGPGASLDDVSLEEIEEEAVYETESSLQLQAPLLNQGRLLIKGTGSVESRDPVDNGILGEIEQRTVLSLQGAAEPLLATPALENRGTLSPGGAGAAGPFNLVGTLVQHDTGVIAVELGGLVPSSGHDRLAVQGAAQLAGTLDLSALDGFELEVGQSFVVLTATGGVTGAFDVVSGPAVFGVEYGTTEVTVTVLALAIPGDLNGDGQVGGADLGALLAWWGSCDGCEADLNRDGLVNGADLAILLGHWG